MIKAYRIIFQGLSGDEEDFKVRMAGLGAPSGSVDAIIEKAPIVLKQGVPFEFSKRYADAVRKAGGIVDIQEYGYIEESMDQPISIAPFKDFIMCPECGLKQHKGPVCLKCGFRLFKEEHGLEPKNVAGH